MKAYPRLSLFYLFWTIYFGTQPNPLNDKILNATDAGQTRADVVTLYEISTTATPTLTGSIQVIQSGTTNIRAIGTGADGKTTYVQDNIVSLYVAKFPSPEDPSKTATTTLISEPQTIAVTFAEDKNGYHATRSLSVVPPSSTNSAVSFQGGLDEQCVFFPNGTGSCVRIDIGLDTATRTTFSTRTYTGTPMPWYTAEGSQSQTTTTSNGAYSVKSGSGLGMLGVVMYASISATLGTLVCIV